MRAEGECAANSLGVLEALTGGMLKVQEKLGCERSILLGKLVVESIFLSAPEKPEVGFSSLGFTLHSGPFCNLFCVCKSSGSCIYRPGGLEVFPGHFEKKGLFFFFFLFKNVNEILW